MAVVAPPRSQQQSTLHVGIVAEGGLYARDRIDGSYSHNERPLDLADVARVRAHSSRYYAATQQHWRAERVCAACRNRYTIAESLGRWQCRRHVSSARECCRDRERPANLTPMQWLRGCVACDHDDGSTSAPLSFCVAVVVPAPLVGSLAHTPQLVSECTLRELGSSTRDPYVGSVVCEHPSALPLRYADVQQVVFTADLPLE